MVKIMNLNLYELVVVSSMLGILGIAGSGVINKTRNEEKQRQYDREVDRLSNEAQTQFDNNQNGILDPNERVNLLNQVGYQKVLPSDQIMIDIVSGDYRSGEVKVNLFSHGSYVNVNGLFVDGEGSPAWRDTYTFPFERLEELASSQ